jgi:hypothetical protein
VKKIGRSKLKNRLWILTVPKILDMQTRQHVQKYNISIANFVRKSVNYQIREEEPKLSKKKFVQWLIQVHPSYDKSLRDLAQTNYPSLSSLIRYAVTRQLVK